MLRLLTPLAKLFTAKEAVAVVSEGERPCLWPALPSPARPCPALPCPGKHLPALLARAALRCITLALVKYPASRRGQQGDAWRQQ